MVPIGRALVAATLLCAWPVASIAQSPTARSTESASQAAWPEERSVASAPSVREPSAADRLAAGQTYDRATAAYLARDYARAAPLFETAYRLAPAAAPLVQAVRAHERAGNHLRAATLALRLAAFYPNDEAAQRQAESTLSTSAGNFLRIDVICSSACTLELDGQLQEHSSFFASPGEPHVVRATFEHGVRQQSVSGAAGTVETLSFEAPVADGTDASPEPIVASREPARDGPEPSGGGVHPAAFAIGAALTLSAAGALVWSGIDALDGVPAYRAMPTLERLRDGQTRELRTNVLVGVTSALAVATLVLALATDWDGERRDSSATAPRAHLFVGPNTTTLVVEGSFR